MTVSSSTTTASTSAADAASLDARISSLRASLQSTHNSRQNQSLSWRLEALRTMQRMILHNKQALLLALAQDLGKHETEAYTTEVALLESEITLFLGNLHTWLQPTQVTSPMACLPAFSRIHYQPLGAPGVLILGPFNYPLLLCLQPAIGSLAAGNPTLIKPSELAPATSQLLETLVAKYFGPAVLSCIQGGPETAQALLQHSWGMVLFTGSERVGRLVAQAAAATLTPVVLELGGKCPAVLDETALARNMSQISHRLVWAKTLNAGQTCAAVDYVLVHESHVDPLSQCLIEALTTQFGTNVYESELGRIVSVPHAERLLAMIVEVELAIENGTAPAQCKILTGGSRKCKPKERFIYPTMIVNPPFDCRLMREEIFGPILPILAFAKRDEAVGFVKSIPLTPLCVYVFTSRQDVLDNYISKIPSGSVMHNDCLVHLMSSTLPFGGLGTSGHGKYHGKFSLDTFSHSLSVMSRPLGPGLDWGRLRCHPFQGRRVKQWLLHRLILKLPNVPVGIVRRIVGGCLVAIFVQWLLSPMRLELTAQVLEHMAQWLRSRI